MFEIDTISDQFASYYYQEVRNSDFQVFYLYKALVTDVNSKSLSNDLILQLECEPRFELFFPKIDFG
jgi:hypothetical protein